MKTIWSEEQESSSKNLIYQKPLSSSELLIHWSAWILPLLPQFYPPLLCRKREIHQISSFTLVPSPCRFSPFFLFLLPCFVNSCFQACVWNNVWKKSFRIKGVSVLLFHTHSSRLTSLILCFGVSGSASCFFLPKWRPEQQVSTSWSLSSSTEVTSWQQKCQWVWQNF